MIIQIDTKNAVWENNQQKMGVPLPLTNKSKPHLINYTTALRQLFIIRAGLLLNINSVENV